MSNLNSFTLYPAYSKLDSYILLNPRYSCFTKHIFLNVKTIHLSSIIIYIYMYVFIQLNIFRMKI